MFKENCEKLNLDFRYSTEVFRWRELDAIPENLSLDGLLQVIILN